MKDKYNYQLRLINFVEKHPILYNSSLNDYLNHNKNDSVWELFAKEECIDDIKTVKNDWRSLKSSFRQFKANKGASGSDMNGNQLFEDEEVKAERKRINQFPFYNEMLFLDVLNKKYNTNFFSQTPTDADLDSINTIYNNNNNNLTLTIY
jgi:hypothetical protein